MKKSLNLDPNIHPMHPAYAGPTSGMFICIHHEFPLIEFSGNIMDRVKLYNDGRTKPAHEIPARSAAMMWLDMTQFPGAGKLCEADKACQEASKARREAYEARWEADKACQEAYEARREAYKAWQEAYKACQEGYEAWQEAHKAWEEAHKAWFTDHPEEVSRVIALLKEQGVTWREGSGIDFENF